MIGKFLNLLILYNNSVFNVFRQVECGVFAPDTRKGEVHMDFAIEVKLGYSMIELQVLGSMLQYLNLKPSYKVLVVSCATGYTDSLVRSMGCEIIGIEPDESLFDSIIFDGAICIFMKYKQQLEKEVLGQAVQPCLQAFLSKKEFKFC